MSGVTTLPRLEVANAHFVAPTLLTGGDLHHDLDRALDQLDELVEAGVTHIVDNRIEWSDEALVRDHAPHIRYLHNPADDRGQRMDDAWFAEARAFARVAWLDPDAKVLAHCHMGINRGPSIAYSLLLDLGWDHIEAFDAVRSARDIAHMGYVEDALDHHLRSIGASSAERRVVLSELAAHRRLHDFDVREVIRRVRAARGGSVDQTWGPAGLRPSDSGPMSHVQRRACVVPSVGRASTALGRAHVRGRHRLRRWVGGLACRLRARQTSRSRDRTSRPCSPASARSGWNRAGRRQHGRSLRRLLRATQRPASAGTSRRGPTSSPATGTVAG